MVVLIKREAPPAHPMSRWRLNHTHGLSWDWPKDRSVEVVSGLNMHIILYIYYIIYIMLYHHTIILLWVISSYILLYHNITVYIIYIYINIYIYVFKMFFYMFTFIIVITVVYTYMYTIHGVSGWWIEHSSHRLLHWSRQPVCGLRSAVHPPRSGTEDRRPSRSMSGDPCAASALDWQRPRAHGLRPRGGRAAKQEASCFGCQPELLLRDDEMWLAESIYIYMKPETIPNVNRPVPIVAH